MTQFFDNVIVAIAVTLKLLAKNNKDDDHHITFFRVHLQNENVLHFLIIFANLPKSNQLFIFFNKMTWLCYYH